MMSLARSEHVRTSTAIDFANYAPEGADHVQRMRDCLLLMAVVGFPAFAIGLFA